MGNIETVHNLLSELFFLNSPTFWLITKKNTSFTSAKSSSVTRVGVEVVVLVLPIFSSGFLRPSGEFLIFQRARDFLKINKLRRERRRVPRTFIGQRTQSKKFSLSFYNPPRLGVGQSSRIEVNVFVHLAPPSIHFLAT